MSEATEVLDSLSDKELNVSDIDTKLRASGQ